MASNLNIFAKRCDKTSYYNNRDALRLHEFSQKVDEFKMINGPDTPLDTDLLNDYKYIHADMINTRKMHEDTKRDHLELKKMLNECNDIVLSIVQLKRLKRHKNIPDQMSTKIIDRIKVFCIDNKIFYDHVKYNNYCTYEHLRTIWRDIYKKVTDDNRYQYALMSASL